MQPDFINRGFRGIFEIYHLLLLFPFGIIEIFFNYNTALLTFSKGREFFRIFVLTFSNKPY